ncbi:MAG: hypothetical protein AB1649_02465, partial [Chloroflexota bacterium]
MATGNRILFKHAALIATAAILLLINFQGVQAAAPSNDDFGSAELIIGTHYDDLIDNITTTATPKSGDPANDDPVIPCNNGLPGLATVWYKFIAPANGILQVDTGGSSYNTVAAIWTGSRGALSLMACNDDWYELVPNHTSFTSASVVQGTTYYVEIAQVGGTSAAAMRASDSDDVGTLSVTDQLVLSVDFFEVSVAGVGFYDDRDSHWTYTGTWSQFDGPGPYADTHTYTSTQNNSAEFNFTGTQLALYYTAASDGGHLEVWIDGIQIPGIYIEQNSGTTLWQQIWTSSLLDPGTHRVKLNNLTGTTYIDAIRVSYQVAPLGDIGIDYSPTYQWGQVTGATWYYLWVNGPSGKVLDHWYQSSSICGAGLCSINPGVTLGGGNHTWWVQTWNSAGYGPWSSAKNFTTAIPVIPAKPILTGPTGNIGTNYSPTYIFSDAGAT